MTEKKRPVLVTDDMGNPLGFFDLNEISTRAEAMTKEIVLAACVDRDLDKAGDVILSHLDQLKGDQAAGAAVAVAALGYLAAVLQTLSTEIARTAG